MRVWPWHSGKTGLQPKDGLPRPRGSVTLSESLRRLGQLPLQGVGRKDVALPTSPRLAAAVGSGEEAPCGPATLPPGARAATPGPGGTAGGSHALRGEGHSRQVRLLLILCPKCWAGAAPRRSPAGRPAQGPSRPGRPPACAPRSASRWSVGDHDVRPTDDAPGPPGPASLPASRPPTGRPPAERARAVSAPVGTQLHGGGLPPQRQGSDACLSND